MSKKLWELYPHIWKTESAFMSWIRGGIRRSLWNRSPIKLEFIKNNRIKIEKNGRMVWGGVCALTGETFQLKDLEVDHIKGNHSLRGVEDLQSFVEAIVLVTEGDLQFVSKEAHRAKSYADKMGMSFEDALMEKEIIKWSKKPVKEVIDFCLSKGYSKENLSNAKKRREVVRQIIMKGDYETN